LLRPKKAAPPNRLDGAERGLESGLPDLLAHVGRRPKHYDRNMAIGEKTPRSRSNRTGTLLVDARSTLQGARRQH